MFCTNLNPATPPDRASAAEQALDIIAELTVGRNQYAIEHQESTGEYPAERDSTMGALNSLIENAQSFLAELLGGRN